MTHPQPDCRIYLVVEATPAAVEHLTAATEVADIACCLIVPTVGGAIEAAAARPLVARAQQAGVAALLADASDLVRTLRADGVHLNPARHLLEAYTAARQTLGPDAIVGAAINKEMFSGDLILKWKARGSKGPIDIVPVAGNSGFSAVFGPDPYRPSRSDWPVPFSLRNARSGAASYPRGAAPPPPRQRHAGVTSHDLMPGLSRSSQDSVAAKTTTDQPSRSRNQRSPPG